MKLETKEQREKEKGFALLNSFEIVDNIPPPFKKVREDKKEVIEFFNKLPENKVMKIRFPTESLWNTYHTALRYYASDYLFDMQFKKRKDEGGYFLYIKKLKRVETEGIAKSINCSLEQASQGEIKRIA